MEVCLLLPSSLVLAQEYGASAMTVDFLKKNWRNALGYIAITSAASSGGNATSPSKTSSSWRRHSQFRRGICSLTFHDQWERELPGDIKLAATVRTRKRKSPSTPILNRNLVAVLVAVGYPFLCDSMRLSGNHPWRKNCGKTTLCDIRESRARLSACAPDGCLIHVERHCS
jgi:hypothetical protein